MVCKRTQIRKIAREIVKGLEKRKKFSVEQVILFGSYAWGKPTKNSDVDIAVVSSNFKKWDDIKRIEILSDVARHVYPNLDVDIDVVGFTSREIESASYFDLAAEIRQKGQVIYKKAA